MKIKKEVNPIYLPPKAGNPRNSEGSFIELDDGRIAFAYSRYTGDSFEDDAQCCIACIYSYDRGESWDTDNVQILVSADEFGQKNAMSVTLRRMDNGDIGLFFLVKYEPMQRTKYILRRYRNDFSEPHHAEILVAPEKVPADYIVNNDRVVRTAGGRWIALAAQHATSLVKDEGDSSWFDHYGVAQCFVSDDDGYTWRSTNMTLSLNNNYSKSGLQEPGLVELPSGVLYGYFRTDLKCQYESLSIDGGEHWTAPAPSRFYSPNSPMLIKRNPHSGLYYAVWNPTPSYFGRKMHDGVWGRTPLVIAESEDGINFSEPQIIEDDEERGFCYPAMYFLDDKNILLGYCSGGKNENICLNRLTVRKITLEHEE